MGKYIYVYHYLKCFVLETSDDSVEIEVPFKVGMWDLKQCDPKRCTGRKLMRLEMIDKLGMSAIFNGIVLTPVATEVITYCCNIDNLFS